MIGCGIPSGTFREFRTSRFGVRGFSRGSRIASISAFSSGKRWFFPTTHICIMIVREFEEKMVGMLEAVENSNMGHGFNVKCDIRALGHIT